MKLVASRDIAMGNKYGSSNPVAKLTSIQVGEIRELLKTKMIAEIARMYNVSWPTISRIKNGVSYSSDQ
jgi:hypothetical protein